MSEAMRQTVVAGVLDYVAAWKPNVYCCSTYNRNP
jgi:hypothetical protein